MNNKIALRMDDVGASSKRFEVYSKKLYGLCNFLFLKRLPGLKAWGVYREMIGQEWLSVFELLDKYNAKLTVAVTACWVEYDGSLIPFPEKFPEEAEVLKKGHEKGLIEIANHGLTHCVLHDNLFRPRLFSSNRTYHREFWSWVDKKEHEEHIKISQEILQNYFGCNVTTLVPPGNVFTDSTINAAGKHGIKIINCNTSDKSISNVKVLGNDNVVAFHDKEIVEDGVEWLEHVLKLNMNKEFVFVRDL